MNDEEDAAKEIIGMMVQREIKGHHRNGNEQDKKKEEKNNRLLVKMCGKKSKQIRYKIRTILVEIFYIK